MYQPVLCTYVTFIAQRQHHVQVPLSFAGFFWLNRKDGGEGSLLFMQQLGVWGEEEEKLHRVGQDY